MSNNQLAKIEEKEKLFELQKSSFELEQRKATMLAKSAFFPTSLKGDIASAVLIYDLSERLNLSALEIAQSVYIIHNKPAFGTSFKIARVNTSGIIKGRLMYVYNKDKTSCYAYGICAVTGEKLIGASYSIEQAKKEGLLDKAGSKWLTRPDLMLSYRAATSWINQYAPEVVFGMPSVEELESDYENDINIINAKDINSLSKKQPNDEIIDTEIDIEIEKNPKAMMMSELQKRGLTEEEAGKWCWNKSDDDFLAYLNDPASIDSVAEQIIGIHN